jgi:Na+/H+ antiporter NhaD/arsenite permease-like protein
MTDPVSIALLLLFVLGYAAIALEHVIHINKSWTALVVGAVMWGILSFVSPASHLETELDHECAGIFKLIMFLLGAMTVVEMMGHYGAYRIIERELMRRRMTERKLFFALGLITFFMSAVLDNLTTTLVMIAIGRRIYRNTDNFNKFTINTVIAANAGGAWSPIGDVTTIMIWLEEKFSATQVMTFGILPSLVCWFVPQIMLQRGLHREERLEESVEDGATFDWRLIAVGLGAFFLGVAANLRHLPPFLGMLLGLGIAGMLIDRLFHQYGKAHEEGRISLLIQKADITTLKFFTGILLAVSALHFHGVLNQITQATFGSDPQFWPLVVGNTVIGVISSVLDNVPLTAALLKMLPATVDFHMWVLLAVTVGTGGSLLVIGSAAGVAAMGQVPSLTFGYYLRKGTLPALLGYFAAIGVWLVQYKLTV